MKKLLIGILALISITVFASEVEFQCDVDASIKNQQISSSTLSGRLDLKKGEVAKSVSLHTNFNEVIVFELQRLENGNDSTFRIIRGNNRSVLSATNLNSANKQFESSFDFAKSFKSKKVSGICSILNLSLNN